VQTPDELDEPFHRLMREVAAAGPWAGKLAGAEKSREPTRRADWYFRLLRAHASRVDIWRTTYFHPLGGARAVVEWVKRTALRPFLDPLDPVERADYPAAYEQAIAEVCSAEADGTVLLPFPRLSSSPPALRRVIGRSRHVAIRWVRHCEEGMGRLDM
jgi:trans-aconitate 2-methyltransferase